MFAWFGLIYETVLWIHSFEPLFWKTAIWEIFLRKCLTSRNKQIKSRLWRDRNIHSGKLVFLDGSQDVCFRFPHPQSRGPKSVTWPLHGWNFFVSGVGFSTFSIISFLLLIRFDLESLRFPSGTRYLQLALPHFFLECYLNLVFVLTVQQRRRSCLPSVFVIII
jgi:hypothetical protein